MQIVPVNKQNIGVFEKINISSLEVKYSKKWYNTVLSGEDTGVIAVDDGIPVAGTSLIFGPDQDVYIRTLAVLPQYRRRGAGRVLVDYAKKYAKERGLVRVSVHVWSESVESLKFYEALGFETVVLVPNYYEKLVPRSAWLMSWKEL